MRAILFTCIVVLIITISCSSINVIDINQLDEKKWEELEKISFEDKDGFKVVKTSFKDGQYNTIITTQSSNVKISNEDKRKIEEIMQKYK